MHAELVQEILTAALPDCTIEVSGSGAKFHVKARGQAFAGLMPVKQQQLIYGFLNEHIQSGAIHAVTMDLGTENG
ncbi:BolA/IbaG family iron-sulfur metabolism protein [Salinispirillum marinum]|uniref:BolA/IbaG family iron-sulfur metabolism protein n=2 Tax=Saccharospirillaceae TaxID=255527 RepID=A0ABV8BBH2_9GAMM